jgi:PAS domain S-box-containing protein
MPPPSASPHVATPPAAAPRAHRLAQAALSACAAEPIHTPGGIQPWGALLVVRPDDLAVAQASANAAALLGVSLERLLGAPLGACLGTSPGDSSGGTGTVASDATDPAGRAAADAVAALTSLAEGGRAAFVLPARSARSALVVEAHRHAGRLLVECYAADEGARVARDPAPTIRTLARLASDAAIHGHEASVTAYAERLAAEVRALTGYDRVMVYRFAEGGPLDGAGEVIAEARDATLEPYLGLWYPASDIPPQARALYLRQRVRVLGDVDAAPVPLVAAAARSTTTTTPAGAVERPGAVDLSHATLRAFSPVHLQYLRNMRVRATLVISVIREGRLWGLIACHHHAPRWIPAELRDACDLLGEMLGVHVALLERTDRARAEARVRRATAQLRRAVAGVHGHTAGDWPAVLVADGGDRLLDVLDATGAAVVRGDRVWRTGVTASDDDLRALARWVSDRARRAGAPAGAWGRDGWAAALPAGVAEPWPLDGAGIGASAGADEAVPVAESALGLCEPAFASLAPRVAGILAITLPDADDAVVLWCRREWVHEVTWAGGQEKAVTVADGVARLSPRASFAAWCEEVRGRSAPWTAADLAAAALFRTALVDEVLHLLAREHLLVRRELRRVRQAVDASSEPMAIADPQGRFHFVNPAFTQLFGPGAAPVRALSALGASGSAGGRGHLFRLPGDDPAALAAARRAVAAGVDWRGELWLTVADGARAPIALRVDRITDAAGALLGLSAAFTDLRVQYRAAEERRALETGILESISDAFLAVDEAWRCTYVNHEAERVFGRERGALLGREIWEVLPEARGSEFERHCREAAASGARVAFTTRVGWAAASVVAEAADAAREAWFEVRAYPGAHGLALYLQDVTERYRAERALAEREAQLRAITANLPGGLALLLGRDGRVQVAEGIAQEVTGCAPAALLGRRLDDVLDDARGTAAGVAGDAAPEVAGTALRAYSDAALAGHACSGDLRRGGRTYDTRAVPVRDGSGAVAGAVVLAVDVTHQRHAHDQLRLFEAAFAHLQDIVVITEATPLDAPGPGIVYVNAAFERVTGYPAAEVLGRNPRILQGPDTDRAVLAELRAALARAESCQVEILNYHRDGTPYWLEMAIAPITDAMGRCTHFVAVERDITARRAQEAALRQNEERFRALSAASPVGIFEADQDGALTYANPRLCQLWGAERADAVLGLGWLDHVDPDDRDALLHDWRGALAAGVEFEREYRLRLPDGSQRWVIGRSAPQRGPDGAVTGVVGTVDDLTARRSVEEQLRQSQRLEAMGRLAGGVAHDFNNLLTVIGGNAEFALGALAPDDPSHEDVAEIQRAAARAAGLTRQLLAFSRRQVLQPQVVVLDDVVRGVEKLLRRVIGEDVRLVSALDAVEAHVRADPGQLEQVLVNLAVNARDAMPDGGVLTLRTRCATASELPPHLARGVLAGHDVLLVQVCDSGIGMDAATVARAFEPFFTTKGDGRGTGLGLATVHGIAEQSGGGVWIESAPGVGTTVSVALPVARAGRGAPHGAVHHRRSGDGGGAAGPARRG